MQEYQTKKLTLLGSTILEGVAMGVIDLSNMCSDIINDDQNHTFSSVLSSLCDSHISRS